MNGFKQATQAIKAKMNLANLEMIEELTYQNKVYEEAVNGPISHDDWMKFKSNIRHNNQEILDYTKLVKEYDRQRKLLEYGEKVVGY